jgi:hypothetical protein
MILKDKNNHDVSAILHKILSANPRKVLETFIDNHDKSIIIHQVINTEETKNNMEEDNNIRAAGNGFFYGPNSIHCKGQWKMAANC